LWIQFYRRYLGQGCIMARPWQRLRRFLRAKSPGAGR